MTERELREIKRRFRPEKSNIPNIVGAFINENGEIIYKITQSIALTDSVASEKLLGVMKKSLSGSLGTNLIDMPFSTKQVTDSAEHKLLTSLLKTDLRDEAVLDEFYNKVRESIKLESNYVILLAKDTYDVFHKSSDGESESSGEVFSYIVCAICPVKTPTEALTFREADKLFHLSSVGAILSSPELGFMFPTFEDRRTNIYNALFYTRSVSESYPEFTDKIFASEPPMPPRAQKATFNECLSDALGEECTYEVVRSVHAQVAEMIEAHKEAKEEEPLLFTKETVKEKIREIEEADCEGNFLIIVDNPHVFITKQHASQFASSTHTLLEANGVLFDQSTQSFIDYVKVDYDSLTDIYLNAEEDIFECDIPYDRVGYGFNTWNCVHNEPLFNINKRDLYVLNFFGDKQVV